MGFCQWLCCGPCTLRFISSTPLLSPAHSTPTHPRLGARGNSGLGQGPLLSEAQGRWGLELLPRETHLLWPRLQQRRLETKKKNVCEHTALVPAPPRYPLLPTVGRVLWSWDQRREWPLPAFPEQSGLLSMQRWMENIQSSVTRQMGKRTAWNRLHAALWSQYI